MLKQSFFFLTVASLVAAWVESSLSLALKCFLWDFLREIFHFQVFQLKVISSPHRPAGGALWELLRRNRNKTWTMAKWENSTMLPQQQATCGLCVCFTTSVQMRKGQSEDGGGFDSHLFAEPSWIWPRVHGTITVSHRAGWPGGLKLAAMQTWSLERRQRRSHLTSCLMNSPEGISIISQKKSSESLLIKSKQSIRTEISLSEVLKGVTV